ncbi:TrkH family potassium uptake protein [Citroniella saccharovorans]|uniref:TrkH family potassium uptake protein n=1 Tax=Citroniella saccharovorans TaxID=2053367 RepID=A0AAW9MW63_9FIRM|nr:TrkH family potassium uptake protein [Citroniella saccharovorans]MEB3430008.1 TrkH family potassium uptake protein [Citroniella saccharovorans]
MNKRVVLKTIGELLILEGILMILPLIIGIIYKDSTYIYLSFLKVGAFITLLGLLLTRINTKGQIIGVKEGLGIVSISWIVLSFFGSLPFVISKSIPSLVDAFFETTSGFTTTGASILTDVEKLPISMTFWRSFTHFIGGMGILVFALAVLPKGVRGDVNVMKAEVPGPQFGKLVSKASITAMILYKIYIIMTLVLIIILLLLGMSPIDAMVHAFGAAGTGGFSNKATSVAYFNSPAIEYTLAIAMLLYGINFNLYYYLLLKKFKEVFSNEELKVYFFVVTGAIILIMVNIFRGYNSGEKLFRDTLFQVSSIVTTTGYATVNFNKWPLFSHVVLLALMFIGGMSGSTAGGIKVSRINSLFKIAKSEVIKIMNPDKVIFIRENNRPLKKSVLSGIKAYIIVYIFVFAGIFFLVSFKEGDFLSNFSAVAATMNNIGPGLGIVGPDGSFAAYSNFSKLVFSMAMIIGRLEIYPVLVLFTSNLWRKR